MYGMSDPMASPFASTDDSTFMSWSIQPRKVEISDSGTPRMPVITRSGSVHDITSMKSTGSPRCSIVSMRSSAISSNHPASARISAGANAPDVRRRMRVCRGGSIWAMIEGSSWMRPSIIRGLSRPVRAP